MDSSTPRSGWSVHGLQSAWGNIGASSDPSDSPTSVEWRESSTPAARIQDSTTQRWTSTVDDRTFMGDWNFATQYVISVSRDMFRICYVLLRITQLHY